MFDASSALLSAPLPIPGVAAEETEWWSVLSLGGAGSGLPLHEHGATWLALARGRKRWAAFPPGTTPPLSPCAPLSPFRFLAAAETCEVL